MTQPEKSDPGTVPESFKWRAGQILRPVSPRIAAAEPIRFQTCSVPGELATLRGEANVDWSFDVGVDQNAAPRTQFIPHGFRLAGPETDDEVILLCRPGGILSGYARGRYRPHLFAPALQQDTVEEATFLLSDAGVEACLVVVELEAEVVFALAVGNQPREELEAAARREIRSDLPREWAQFWAPRATAQRVLAAHAAQREEDIEQLYGAVMPPDEFMPTRWVRSGEDSQPRYDLNAALCAILAISAFDRRLAGELLGSALFCAHDDGWIPAVTKPDQPGLDQHRALPCFALLARSLRPAPEELQLWHRALARNVLWWTRGFTTMESADLGPDTPAISDGAMAALLASESGALLDLIGSGDEFPDAYEPIRDAFRTWMTAAEAWISSTHPRTAAERAIAQIFFLRHETLSRPPIDDRKIRPAASTSELFLALLHPHLDAMATAPSLPTPRGPTLSEAALRIAHDVIHARLPAVLPVAPRVTRWIDRHPAYAFIAGLLVTALLVTVIVRLTVLRPLLTTSEVEARLGMASYFYNAGKYADALRTYEEIDQRGGNRLSVKTQCGNACFRLGRYADAAAYYWAAMERDDKAPMPALNYALTLFELGNWQKSLDEYRLFAHRFDEAYPDLAERAKVAAGILEELLPPTAPKAGNPAPKTP